MTVGRAGERHASLQGEVLHARGRLAHGARQVVVQRGHRASSLHQVNMHVFHQVNVHVFCQVNIHLLNHFKIQEFHKVKYTCVSSRKYTRVRFIR